MAVTFKRKTAVTNDGYLDATFSDLSDGQNTNIFISGGNRVRMGLWNLQLSNKPTFGNAVLAGASLNLYCTSAETPENATLGEGTGTGTEDGHVIKLFKLKTNKTLNEGSTAINNMDILAFSACQFDSNAILFEDFTGTSFYSEPDIKVQMNETYKLKESGPYVTLDDFHANQKGRDFGRSKLSKQDIYRNYAFKPFHTRDAAEDAPWVQAAILNTGASLLRGVDRIGLPNVFNDYVGRDIPTLVGNEQIPMQKGHPLGLSNVGEQVHHQASRASNYIKSGTNYWKKKLIGGDDVVKTGNNHIPDQLWKPKYGNQILQDDIYVKEKDVNILYEASDVFETVPVDIPLLKAPPQEMWVTKDNTIFTNIRKSQNVKFTVEGAEDADKSDVDIAQSNFVFTQADSTQAALMENIHAYFSNDPTSEGHIQSATGGQDFLQEVRSQVFIPAPLHLDPINAFRYEQSPFIDLNLRLDMPIAYTPINGSETPYTDATAQRESRCWTGARALWLMFNRYPIMQQQDICKFWSNQAARDGAYGVVLVKAAFGIKADTSGHAFFKTRTDATTGTTGNDISGKYYAIINAHDMYSGVNIEADAGDYTTLPFVDHFLGTARLGNNKVMAFVSAEAIDEEYATFRFWCTSDGIKLGVYQPNEEGELSSILIHPHAITQGHTNNTYTSALDTEKPLQYVSICGNVRSHDVAHKGSVFDTAYDYELYDDNREWSAARKYHIKSDRVGTSYTGTANDENRAKGNFYQSGISPGGYDNTGASSADKNVGINGVGSAGLQYMWNPWFTMSLTNIRADGERVAAATSISGFGAQEQWRDHLKDGAGNIQDTVSRCYIDSFGAYRFNYMSTNASVNSGNQNKSKLVLKERSGYKFLPLSPDFTDQGSKCGNLNDGWDPAISSGALGGQVGTPGMGHRDKDMGYICFGFKNKSDIEGTTKWLLMNGYGTVPSAAATKFSNDEFYGWSYSNDMHPMGEFFMGAGHYDAKFPTATTISTNKLVGLYGANAESVPVDPFPRLRGGMQGNFYRRNKSLHLASHWDRTSDGISNGITIPQGLSSFEPVENMNGADIVMSDGDVYNNEENDINKFSQAGLIKFHWDAGSDAAFALFTDCSYNNSTTITHTADSRIRVGMSVEGTGIPVDTYIEKITNSTNFVISNATTGGLKEDQTVTFSQLGNWLVQAGSATLDATPNTDTAGASNGGDYKWRPETSDGAADVDSFATSFGLRQKAKSFTHSVTTVNASDVITYVANASIMEGQSITGTGIPYNTRIMDRLTATTARMTQAATAGASVTGTFGGSMPDYIGPNLNATLLWSPSTLTGALRNKQVNVEAVDTDGYIHSHMTGLGATSYDGNKFMMHGGEFVRRECPFVQARIMGVSVNQEIFSPGDEYWDISVDDSAVLENAEDELYIVYHGSREWVPTYSGVTDYSGDANDMMRQNKYCCALAKVEKLGGNAFRLTPLGTTDDHNEIGTNTANLLSEGEVIRKDLRRLIYDSLEDGDTVTSTRGYYVCNDDAYIPRGKFLNSTLCISPWRYWLVAQVPLQDYKKTYNAVCEITSTVDPDFSEAAGTTTCALQSTYSERQYTDSGVYSKYWNFEKSTESELDLGTDFGYGTFNDETLEGGYAAKQAVLTGGYNEFVIDGIVLSGSVEESESLAMVSFPDDVTNNMIMQIESSEGTNTPFLLTTFMDERPIAPTNFSVKPNEDSSFYPEFSWETSDEDLWYGFLLVDSEPILHQYHKAVLHMPMNEQTVTDGSDTIKFYNPDQGTYYKGISDVSKLEVQGGFATVTGPTTSIEGLAGNNINFDGTDDYLIVTNESYTKPTTEMSIVMHVIPDEKPSATSGQVDKGTVLIDKTYEYKIWIDDNAQVNAKVWPDTGSTPTVDDIPVEVKSASSVIYDNYTPTCIILTVDTTLKFGNVKLFINGKLEDQSGLLKAAASANNWKIDASIEDFTGSDNDLCIGSANPAFTRTGTYFNGKMEELVIYDYLIHPVTPNDNKYIFKKPVEELSTGSEASSLTYSARLFIKDYHNIRGVNETNVSCSPITTFRKAAFRLRTN